MARAVVSALTLAVLVLVSAAHLDQLPRGRGNESKEEPTGAPEHGAPAGEAPEAPASGTGQKPLAEAHRAREEAAQRAEESLKRLKQFVQRMDEDTGPQNVKETAETVERGAARIVDGPAEAANKAFQYRLSALSHAAPSEPLHQLEKDATQAAKEVEKMGQWRAKEMKSILSRMQKDKKDHARNVASEAAQAAREALKASKHLETAQRQAGISEEDYESSFDRSEGLFEGMEDQVDMLHDLATDAVEEFYDQVERAVEDRADSIKDEARHHRKALERSARGVKDNVAKRRAKAAKAAKAAEEAAAKAAKDAKKAAATAAKHAHEGPPTPVGGGEQEAPPAASGKARGTLSAVLTEAPVAGPALEACALGALFAAACYAFMWSRSARSLAESPLLG